MEKWKPKKTIQTNETNNKQTVSEKIIVFQIYNRISSLELATYLVAWLW